MKQVLMGFVFAMAGFAAAAAEIAPDALARGVTDEVLAIVE